MKVSKVHDLPDAVAARRRRSSSFWRATVAIALITLTYLAARMKAALIFARWFRTMDGYETAVRSWLVSIDAPDTYGRLEGFVNEDGASTTTLYALVHRRGQDGLIIIKPIEWYIYYRAQSRQFYYLTGDVYASSENGGRGRRRCPCTILTASDEQRPPVSSVPSSPSSPRSGELNVSFGELLSVFATDRSVTRVFVNLDELLLAKEFDDADNDDHHHHRITVSVVLNRLISLGAL